MPQLMLRGVAASLALLATVSAQTLLNDSFSDLDRTNQDLPSSSAWFTISPTSSLTATSGTLVTTTTQNRAFYTYFTSSSVPQSLAVGDSLQASFDLTFPTGTSIGTSNHAVRIGLLNSFATADNDNATATAFRATTDGAGISANIMPDASGYFFTLNAAPTTTDTVFAWERVNSASSGQGILNTAFAAQLGGAGGSDLNFVLGNTYSVSFTVTRTAEDVTDLTLAISGTFLDADGFNTVTGTQSLSVSDTSTAVYTFDTLALFTGTNLAAAGTISLDNINVSVSTSAIPEPGTWAVIAGGIALGFVFFRRHRRSVSA